MPTLNKGKTQLAVARELKRVRSVNLAEEKIYQAEGSFWPPLSSTYADSVSESDTGSESDNSVASSEEEEDGLEWDSGLKLKWKRGAERRLRGGYGAGSRSSEWNRQERLNDLGTSARQFYNLVALWKRQEELQQKRAQGSLSQGS